jgi:structural maintenance of chromosome 1
MRKKHVPTEFLLCSSWEYRDQYDDLKQKMEEAIENSAHTFNRKRSVAQEIKQYEEQKAEAEKFEELVADRRDCVVQYLLWKLFHIDQKSRELIDESNNKHINKNDAEFDVVCKKSLLFLEGY